MHSSDVLPSLFGQGDQKVETHDDVLLDFLLSHLFVSNSNSHAGDFLQLELYAGSQVINFVLDAFVLHNDLREHADFVKSGSYNLGNLLDKGVSG